ncbi:flavin reductase family protein [Hyphomicrobium sp.]|uniref:flavin reductase family protein n=1 Tax=Hyphomicrobium sp. TaxID=82 RepID=UPI002E3000ED|nr:flavin reductase family protein [Hyphomicrobium sp.]HEX2842507.1 flavin reductase family protein [Hyphomicrobium sp.]
MSTAPLHPANFRALMRHIPASVSIVATGLPGRRNGLTATSICSLSDSPPKMIACVNHLASAHDEILENRSFSINVLSAGDEHLARMFAADSGVRGEGRFQTDAWKIGMIGTPVLKHALCHLECRLVETMRDSTHTVLLGEVLAGSARSGANPLLYLSGVFRTLLSLVPEAKTA